MKVTVHLDFPSVVAMLEQAKAIADIVRLNRTITTQSRTFPNGVETV